jgi:Uncharacterized conserved protein
MIEILQSDSITTTGGIFIDYIVFLIIFLIVLIILIFYFAYKISRKRNEFTYYSEDVEKWASNLDVQLEKQYDSINSIISLIKNYDKKEYDFVKDVTEARRKNISIFEKSNDIDFALQRIYKIADRTPEITATPMYKDLIKEIKKESSNTASAKKRYTQAASSYNKRISMVPYSYFAKMWGFEKKPLFKTSYQSIQKHESKTKNEEYNSKKII